MNATSTKITTARIAVIGMIAAVYTVLVLANAMLSYGMVQIRLAEALALLPVLSPVAIWGVAIGCLVANLIGWMTGANPIGAMDAVFGTAASIIAGILTYKLRSRRINGIPFYSALPPVLVNAVIIGGQLAFVFNGSVFHPMFLTYALWVGVGQVVACMFLGIPLVKALERKGLLVGI
ncbi:MAG: QueT transporter family protein [Oscillospiraceae bacterium]|nr:QueT transporter family protein [Oscillospiraceae bacterium]